MSALVERIRKVTGRPTDVVTRVEGLQRAVEAARGRLDPELVAQSHEVVERAAARLRLSADHTVVALAGATGSGKSSLFNELCGLDLAAVGSRRPTTSWALACAWGPEGAAELLDWLEIPKRHQIDRLGMLDESQEDRDLHGLVLLDLPDHDSTEVSHHLEVERLVKLADVLVWVLDPQKYADAAVHNRFLKPLSGHADVMVMLLNHVDELPADSVEETLSDVRRLVEIDGLGGVPVIATSAARGDGLADLRALIVTKVAEKKDARARLAADVHAVAERLADQTGDARPGDLAVAGRVELLDACADAAGVPVVVEAIAAASLLRAKQATGWPVTKWFSRFKPDPLRRLHLDLVTQAGERPSTHVSRTSIPRPSSVQRARVDGAVRAVADDVTRGMAKPWATAVRTASVSRLDDFADGLDKAVANAELGVSRTPLWWGMVRLLQWLLFSVALVGGLWLGVLAVMSYLQLPEPSMVRWGDLPLPTLMLIGGVVLGIVVAVGCRFAAKVSARRRALRADARLRGSIAEVCDELVVEPMRAEVAAYNLCRDGLAVALAR